MESFQKGIENCLKMKEQELRCACTRKDDDMSWNSGNMNGKLSCLRML